MSDSLAGILLHQAEVMAELATDRVRLIAENNCLQARAEKAEAELEAARPLLDTILTAGLSSIPGNFMDASDILQAALAYRESQKTKEGA